MDSKVVRERMYSPTVVIVERDNMAFPKIKPKKNDFILLG
jgi:hypothetical protein